MSQRRLTRVLGTTLAVGTAAVPSATAGTAPPRHATAGGVGGALLPRGTPLTHRELSNATALPSAGSDGLVTYPSADAHGRRIVVSGTVALPSTPPPPGGWPVVSWAHGTTGTADTCAPSEDAAHDDLGVVDPTLDTLVAHGYVVVQAGYHREPARDFLAIEETLAALTIWYRLLLPL